MDPKISNHYADLLWNGAPVDRVIYTIVDGHRAYLPGNAKPSRWEFDFVRLLHVLSVLHAAEYDRYCKQAGIIVDDR